MKPTNELGVIVLFAQHCEAVGFKIISIQSPFPDAVIVKDGVEYKTEFEYKASSFKTHGHDVRQCDLVICWVNNWPDCPLPVLALSETDWSEIDLSLPSQGQRDIAYEATYRPPIDRSGLSSARAHESYIEGGQRRREEAKAWTKKQYKEKHKTKKFVPPETTTTEQENHSENEHNGRHGMTYKTYRFGNGSALKAMIEKATAHFHKEQGRLPKVLVVNKTLTGDAAALGLALEVEGAGGCHTNEVWLSVGNKVS